MLSRLSNTCFLRNMEKIQLFVHISITCISGSNKSLFWALTEFSVTKQDICHHLVFCRSTSISHAHLSLMYRYLQITLNGLCLLTWSVCCMKKVIQKIIRLIQDSGRCHQYLWEHVPVTKAFGKKKDKIMGITESICILPSKHMRQPKISLAPFLVFLELSLCFM